MKFKELARQGFSKGMAKADETEQTMNIIVSACMMLLGLFGLVFAALKGPDTLMWRLALVAVCSVVMITGYKSLKAMIDSMKKNKAAAMAGDNSSGSDTK